MTQQEDQTLKEYLMSSFGSVLLSQ